MGIDLLSREVYSGKIGDRQYNQVAQAIYILAELYSETPYFSWNEGFPGGLNDSVRAIRWIRYVLDRGLSFHWRTNVWYVYECEMLDEIGEDRKTYDEAEIAKKEKQMYRSIRGARINDEGVLDFLSVLIVEMVSTPSLKEWLETGPYASDSPESGLKRNLDLINEVYNLVQNLLALSGKSGEEMAQLLMDLLVREPEGCKGLENSLLVLRDTLSIVPIPIYTKLVAEVCGQRFWNLWCSLPDQLTAEVHWFSRKGRKRREKNKRLTTEGFLGVTDEDRLLWWREGGDVELSDRTLQWLKEMAGLHRQMFTEAEKSTDILPWQRRLVMVLSRDSKGPMFLEEAFYEFLGSFWRVEYRAAVLLLEARKEESYWQFRKLLSVFGNRALRQKFFGF